MAAAVALAKDGLLTLSLRHQNRLHCLWKTANKHSIPDHLPSPKNAANPFLHRLQSKCRSPFPHSIPRTNGALDFSARTVVSSSVSSIVSSSSPKLGIIAWYLGMINSQPIVTKSITAALTYIVADFSSQTIAGKTSQRYDWARTLRMAAYGMLIIGPSLHYWFNFASRIFPKRDLISTLKKITIGQTVYGPAATAVFFSGNAALQGESGSEIASRLKRDLIPTLLNGIMYWPVCDFVTFRFIPVHLQPLVSNSFSYLWTVYLTYMASLSKVPAR